MEKLNEVFVRYYVCVWYNENKECVIEECNLWFVRLKLFFIFKVYFF